MITKAHLNNTELKNRTLWFDGDSTFTAAKLSQVIQLGGSTDGLFVDELSADIKQFNTLVSSDEQISIKENVRELDFAWNIPEEYKNLDLIDYVADRLLSYLNTLSDEEFEKRAIRTSMELSLYYRLDLTDVLRTIIYIINTLDSKKVVWGVGRGSSVSSYVLYLIGVHDVDSVLYDLDITDFLRTK